MPVLKTTKKRKAKPRPEAAPVLLPAAPLQPALFARAAATPSPVSPPEPSRRHRFEMRVAAVLDRWKQGGDPGLAGAPAGIVICQTFAAVVARAFERNDTDAACATDLVAARKESARRAKKWWKPRPKTEADERIARKFAKCKVMALFKGA